MKCLVVGETFKFYQNFFLNGLNSCIKHSVTINTGQSTLRSVSAKTLNHPISNRLADVSKSDQFCTLHTASVGMESRGRFHEGANIFLNANVVVLVNVFSIRKQDLMYR